MQQIRNYGHQVDKPDIDELIYGTDAGSQSTK